jgi:photosystem II stability/assembly factor-like uncharacterized protein
MPRLTLAALIAALLALLALNIRQQRLAKPEAASPEQSPTEAQADPALDKLQAKHAPADHFWYARSWPDGVFSLQAYEAAMGQARADERALRQAALARGGGEPWLQEGPFNIGGRINTIAVHPLDPAIILVGCASGGIFRTTDAGAHWTPVFDDQPYLPIGDIEFDPNNPNIVYAGTGDPNVSGYPFIGDGLYRSDDGGLTWSNIGLSETRIISRVRVHPLNSNIIYVGAMGLPFEKTADRGVYKSTDGGANWSRVLFLSDSTGICDLLIDENNVNRVWAAGWDRLRNNSYTMVFGPNARIHRSTDGGANWTVLGGGLPGGDQCRIGLDQEPGNPNHLLAQYIGTDMETQGVYESFNGGTTWSPYTVTALSDAGAMGGFGWYFAKARFNPFTPGQVWVLGVNLWRTLNGGLSWTNMTSGSPAHVDNHDLVFLSANEALLATDGGLWRTINGGLSWTRADDIPNTQFYHIQLNPYAEGEIWGGSQDNGTKRGSSIAASAWQPMFGGDGFHTEFNPDNSLEIYVETQNGGLWHSGNGGLWFDWAAGTIPFGDRRNWDMPYILSPHNPNRVYAGTYRVHRSTDDPDLPFFNPISPDLTRGVLTDPRFHNLTTIRESPLVEGLLYTGASDGRMCRSNDGGGVWMTVGMALPNRYITDIECSSVNPDAVFITHSGYKDNDLTPMIHRSLDRGNTWTSLAGDLPPLGINDMEVYPGNDSVLFVANDGGVYASADLGQSWQRLGPGMPVVHVYDIELDLRRGRLVAGTHGRSAMSIDLSGHVPSQLNPVLSEVAVLCAGDTVSLLASGALFYEWSPAAGLSCTDCPNPLASPLTSTAYTVTYRDGLGHSATRTANLVVEPAPATPVLVQSGDSLLATGSSGSYRWYRDGLLLPGEEEAFLQPSVPGLYSVESVSSAGCTSRSSELAWMPSGLEPSWVQSWSFGPNPVQHSAWLSLPELPGHAEYRLRFYDAQGRLQDEMRHSGGLLQRDFAHWKPGLYYLRADALGASRSIKWVKL